MIMPKGLHVLLVATLMSTAGQAADLEAGKRTAQSKCSQCHAAADWEGEDVASLESLISDIVASKVKHSKGRVELSVAEISNVAAFWGAAAKGKKNR
jgi:hypothetical protein